jgi:hypothetical protein
VVVPTIYLIVNEWKGEPFPFACWVVIGFAVGWDLARMIAGKTRGRRESRLLQSRGLRNERANRGRLADDWFHEDLGRSRELMAELTKYEPELRIHMDGEMVCRVSYDNGGSGTAIDVHAGH